MMNIHKICRFSHKQADKVTVATVAFFLGMGANVQAAELSFSNSISNSTSQISFMSSSTHCMSMGQSVGGINQSLSMCAPQSPVTVIQGSTPKQGSVVSQVTNTNTSQITSLNVLAIDQVSTQSTSLNSSDFTKYSTQLGNLLVGGLGVSEFSVTGLNVDPTNPEAFPIKLEFNTKTASFDQEAIEAVPEPLSFFGSVLGAGMMMTIRRWREAKSH